MTPPGKPLGMSDFFALEAGEYLERLDSLLQQSETPGADEVVRLARALRGSGLMGDPQAAPQAAAGGASLAQALRANPLAHDPLQHVLRALQGLRGLAALSDLPPLPDLLEGIERAIAELTRPGFAPPASVGDLFQGAASAIAKSAREVAERGRPDPEGPEFRSFAALLVQLLASEPDVVPVTSLYYEDAGPHVVKQGVPAARPATLGRLELVSHGEHLRQAADSLERAPSPTQRELRAHTLAGTFRALAQAGGGALPERVAQFAAAAREAVSSGVAVRRAAEFAGVLRRAGDLLTRSSAGDEATLAAELDGLTEALHALGGPGAGPLPSPATAGARPAAATAPPPPQAAADAPVPAAPDLVGARAVYHRPPAPGP